MVLPNKEAEDGSECSFTMFRTLGSRYTLKFNIIFGHITPNDTKKKTKKTKHTTFLMLCTMRLKMPWLVLQLQQVQRHSIFQDLCKKKKKKNRYRM
jgi:hypothetical protein